MKIAWLHRHDLSRGGYWISLSMQSMTKHHNCEITPVYLGWLEIIRCILQPSRLKDYDLVHVWDGGLRAFVVGLALHGRHKSILQLSGSDWYGVPIGSSRHRLIGLINRLASRLSLKFYQSVIVMSNRMAQEIRATHSRIQIDVIPDAIDIEAFSSRHKTVIDKRNSNLNLRGYHQISLFCNDRGSSLKRPGLAARAFQRARSICPVPIRFKWVCSIPKSKMPTEMDRCDLLILTSTHEGYPNVVKEALASNTPFVATNVSDLQCLANSTKSCFVTRANATDLAECIIRSLTANCGLEDLRGLSEQFRQSKKDETLMSLYTKTITAKQNTR